jgi:2-methylcitrate dehydratase PrpD
MMTGPTESLAHYAINLQYEDIPPDVLQRAKNTIADGVGAMIFGYDLPWSQIVVDYALKYGRGGKCHILGKGGPQVSAPFAALANGALAHAFELDGATKPSFGVHPCATVFPAALAIAQEIGGSGRDVLTAFVAATEVMVRIGRATKKSNEHRGFHGPGTTGPFGAALGAGLLMGLDAERMTNALGIAASLACGIVQFTRSGTGAMVKRLHFGRANESGVLAANLAADGFTGPHDALEGELGFLRVFCNEIDEVALTATLGKKFETLGIYMKRFACHGCAQVPLQALQELQAEHGFTGQDIEAIEVSGSEERVDRHNQLEPEDPMLAQYSVPFSLALACFRDPRDPRAFDQSALADPAIRSLTRRVRYFISSDPEEQESDINTVTVELKNGKRFGRQARTFLGTPSMLPSQNDVYEKFAILTRHCAKQRADEIFERIQGLEHEKDIHWMHI